MSRRAPALADAIVPFVVVAVIAVGAHSADARPLSFVMGIAAGLALFARRRFPASTLAVSGGLVLVLLHTAPEAGATAVIAPAVALYSLALRRSLTARAVAGGVAVIAIVVAEVLQHEGPTLLQTLGHALLVAIPLLIADVHRTRHANMRLLRDQLAAAQHNQEQEAERRAQAERLRIARDLHDVVAHTLTTINVQASTAAELLDQRPEHARDALRVIEHATRDAIDELRAILGVLRSDDDRDAPLDPTPGFDDLADLVRQTRADAVDVEVHITGERPSRIPEAVSLASYRIAQESLTNARRHAAGAPVRIAVDFGERCLDLTVTNGMGASPDLQPHGAGTGVGILGMTERAASIGGTVRAGQVSEGFRMQACLPYGPA